LERGVRWAYYNDNDAFCCEWLRNLIAAGHISEGEVDERPIQEVAPSDVQGFRQVHFFAGIGGWAYALRLAGWPPEEPVWTGSCPCQPYSQAGRGLGDKDLRNFWPFWQPLIKECSPTVIFGEQTAGKAAREWLSRVRSDLEGMGYAVGAADLPAASLAAPHIRQKLFWVADASGKRCEREQVHLSGRRSWEEGAKATGGGTCGMDDAASQRAVKQGAPEPQGDRPEDGISRKTGPGGEICSSGSSVRNGGTVGERSGSVSTRDTSCGIRHADDAGLTGRGPWKDFDLAYCTDNKSRRIESGSFPLAFGLPRSMGQVKPEVEALGLLAKATETLTGAKSNRVGRLRGYGNAIVPQVAAEFIQAWKETK